MIISKPQQDVEHQQQQPNKCQLASSRLFPLWLATFNIFHNNFHTQKLMKVENFIKNICYLLFISHLRNESSCAKMDR
jgi:hypothetical protein